MLSEINNAKSYIINEFENSLQKNILYLHYLDQIENKKYFLTVKNKISSKIFLVSFILHTETHKSKLQSRMESEGITIKLCIDDDDYDDETENVINRKRKLKRKKVRKSVSNQDSLKKSKRTHRLKKRRRRKESIIKIFIKSDDESEVPISKPEYESPNKSLNRSPYMLKNKYSYKSLNKPQDKSPNKPTYNSSIKSPDKSPNKSQNNLSIKLQD